jgi:hypothetical protein
VVDDHAGHGSEQQDREDLGHHHPRHPKAEPVRSKTKSPSATTLKVSPHCEAVRAAHTRR